MTKEEFDELTETIRGYFDKWADIVTCYGWKFDINYYGTRRDLPSNIDPIAAMTVFSDWSRLTASIHVHLEEMGRAPDKIEEIVVHELVHMLLSPIDDDAEEDNLELTVTWVSRLILGARLDE